MLSGGMQGCRGYGETRGGRGRGDAKTLKLQIKSTL